MTLTKYYDILKDIKSEDIRDEQKTLKNEGRKSLHIINDLLTGYSGVSKRKASSTLLLYGFKKALTNFKENKKNINLLKKIMEELDRILRVLFDRNLNTLNNSVRPFRMVLREILTDGRNNDFYKDSFDFFGLNRKERLDRRIDYQKSVKDRNNTRGSLTPIYMEDVTAWVDNLKSLPNTPNNVYDKIILLLLVSGVRFIELLKKSTFSSSDDEQKIKVSNLAKKYKDNETSERYLINMKVKDFLDTLDYVKKTLMEVSPVSLNHKLNKRFRILFSHISNPIDDICDITLRYARVIYANMNYKLNAEPKNIPYESFLQTELGHRDPISTKSYLCINLLRKKDNTKQPKQKKTGKGLDPKKIVDIVDDLKKLDAERIRWTYNDIKRFYNLSCPNMREVMELYNMN